MKIMKTVMTRIRTFMDSPKALYLWWGLATLFAGAAVCYLFNMAGFAGQADLLGFTQSALSPVCFVVVGYFLRKLYYEYQKIEDVKLRRRRFWFSFVFGSLLALSFILGYQMRIIGNTLPGYKEKLVALIMSAGCGMAFLPLTNLWFVLLERLGNREACGEMRVELSGKTKKKIFWFSWLGIFLCWIPVFLAYYPAIMSYDFNRQIGEASRGYIWFNDHHPLVHTFLIRVFLLMGEAMGSYEAGMALFSLLQMLVLSVVLAYSCNVVGRITRRVWPVVVMAVIYGILPVHPVLAMSMTKDILFTAFFLLLILLMWEKRRIVTKVSEKGSRGKYRSTGLTVAMLAVGILTMLFRNNAVYAFAVFAVFYVIFSAGERLKIALLCIAIVAGGLGCKTAVKEAMDAGSGSSAEMYSVFMQQFARVGRNQGAVLTEEERAAINNYVPEYLWESYNPPISDTIKGSISAYHFDVWKADVGQMLSTWVKIGLKYPNEYIDAFLALTSGYWFLDDVSHAEVLTYGEDTQRGLLYTFNSSQTSDFAGIENRSLFPALLSAYEKIVNGNSYYGWPVVSMLFKPSFYCWLLFLVMVSYWYRKEPKKQLFALLPLLYLLTLFLGPVVHIRYVYPIMVVVPVLIAQVFCKESKKEE